LQFGAVLIPWIYEIGKKEQSSLMRTLSTIAILMGLGAGGIYSVADSNPTPKKGGAEQIQLSLGRLTQTLSKLAPIRTVLPSLIGFPPNFTGVNYCWTFENGGSDLYRRVAEMMADSPGAMRWRFNSQFNQKGACISVVASSSEFYSPILDLKAPGAHAGSDRGSEHSLVDEIDKLCDFLESELGGAGGKQRGLSIQETYTWDEVSEPSVYDVVLVNDVKRFHWPTPTSEVDRKLSVGLTYDEWYSLFFQVLRKSVGQSEDRPVDFQEPVDGYPILSRLNDIHDDVTVEQFEVRQLRSECLRVEAISTGNTAAQKCLRKLLLICRWAEESKTGIYFSGQ
jgi:hypothetical protein